MSASSTGIFDAPRDGDKKLGNQKVPEPDGRSWRRAEEMLPDCPSREGPSREPKDSDCLPSIFLAVFLAFVFASVSLHLLRHKPLLIPSRDCKALNPGKVCLPEAELRSLCLLFPNQLESMWVTFQERVCNPSGKPWVLAAAGPGDASRTLLCLTRVALSFLTKERGVAVRFLEQSSSRLPRDNRTWTISTVEVYVGQNRVPNGLMVSLQSSPGGKEAITKTSFVLILDGTEQIRENVRVLTPALLSDILSIVLFADRGLNKLKTDSGKLPILWVRTEEYLEGGLAC